MMDIESDFFQPCMPEVDIRADIETIFSRARVAADESVEDDEGLFRRQIVFVTPGRLLIGKTCPLPAEIPPKEMARVKDLIPPKPVKNIAAISYTFLDALQKDMNRAVPFMGYLLGFATLGHCVWVFEGHESALAAGCRDADYLLVDEGMLPFLPVEWRATAEKAMRGNVIKQIPREK
jgi:hypothetical protein